MSFADLRMTGMPLSGPNSHYGERMLQINGKWKKNFHKGTDHPFGKSTPVSALGDGLVTESPQQEKHKVFGWYLRVECAPGIAYSCHSLNEKARFAVGEQVKLGQTVGFGGKSAQAASGNHCHITLWINGKHVNPYTYLSSGKTVRVTVTGSGVSSRVSHRVMKDTEVANLKEFLMSQIRYVHRVQKGFEPEWMIAGMELPGGFMTTTNQLVAEGWGALYGTSEGDSWKALTRKQYIQLQNSAKALNDKWVEQQKLISHG